MKQCVGPTNKLEFFLKLINKEKTMQKLYRINKLGGSAIITLPPNILSEFKMKVGDYVLINARKSGIIIKPIKQKKENIT